MGDEETHLPDKQDVARGLLLRGDLFIHLDPRVPGVVVPLQFRQRFQLVLQVGFDMPVPIPDLRVDDAGISGTLSFGRAPFTCMVPWDAVYLLSDSTGRAMIWPDSVPDELREEVEREMGKREPKGLRVLDGGRRSTIPPPPEEGVDLPDLEGHDLDPSLLDEVAEAAAASEAGDPDDEPPRRPPHLRLVKG